MRIQTAKIPTTLKKKKKVKPLPDKSIPLGGSQFVGRSTTG